MDEDHLRKLQAGRERYVRRMRDLYRLGMIDRFQAPRGAEEKREAALKTIERMKTADAELERLRAEQPTIVSGLETHGEKLTQLTGFALDHHERILKKHIPFTEKNMARLRLQTESATAILRIQAKVDQNNLQRARQGILPDVLRLMREAVAEEKQLLESEKTQDDG